MAALWCAVLISQLACADNEESVATSASSSDGGSEPAPTTTAGATEVTDTSGVDTGSPGSTSASTADSGDASDTVDVETTSGTDQCGIDDIIDVLSEGSAGSPIDCGFVTLADPVSDWEAAHVCAMESLIAGEPMFVTWQPQGIDSIGAFAIVAKTGKTYQQFFASWEPKLAASYLCGSVEVDCEVAVGSMCLHCIGIGETTYYCE